MKNQMVYLFTDEEGSKIEIIQPNGYYDTPGEEAMAYREKLEKKLGKPIVAWCHMGGSNPLVIHSEK